MRKQITVPYYNLREAQDCLQRIDSTAGKERVQLRLRRRHHAGETASDAQEVLYKHARALNAFCGRTGNHAEITMEQEVARKTPKKKSIRRTTVVSA